MEVFFAEKIMKIWDSNLMDEKAIECDENTVDSCFFFFFTLNLLSIWWMALIAIDGLMAIDSQFISRLDLRKRC